MGGLGCPPGGLGQSSPDTSGDDVGGHKRQKTDNWVLAQRDCLNILSKYELGYEVPGYEGHTSQGVVASATEDIGSPFFSGDFSCEEDPLSEGQGGAFSKKHWIRIGCGCLVRVVHPREQYDTLVEDKTNHTTCEECKYSFLDHIKCKREECKTVSVETLECTGQVGCLNLHGTCSKCGLPPLRLCEECYTNFGFM